VAQISRRIFIAGAVSLSGRAQDIGLNPSSLAKFVDPLPILPPAKSVGPRNHYRLEMAEVQAKVHRDLPTTRIWGYNGSSPGPTIEARSGQSITVEWANGLPEKHFLPIDHNLHGAEKDKPEVRAVVHVHGAKTRPGDDGYPEDWYVRGKSVTYTYPNDQEAATLWYHDHAMGINRLNIYAGLFGLFLIRDDREDALNLPKGRYEIPLVIYDRSFLRSGALDYPVSGMPDMPWVPEAFGEGMMVNGKLFPYLEVEPCRYRFRLLNAANGRFFHLSLSNGQKFIQIGTDQGLMAAPVELDSFVIAPGERFDLVVDFNGHAGERLVLKSDAFEIMQFRVSKGSVEDRSSIPASLRPVAKMAEALAIKTRRIPLVEIKSGTGDSMTMLLGGRHWAMPITEDPIIDTVEIWEFVNTTEDSHPIHLHLVRFQLLDRRSFDEPLYFRTRQIRYTGPLMPPESYEAGWKDTVRAHSKMITRIIVRFEGYVGRYVWHCHVLEHEDNEMMRPYEVRARIEK
jgi:spore coat protein A, manganese oxidase